MPISIEKEPDTAPFRTREHCCFCFKATSFWHTPKDVAVCLECADVYEDQDVPTKSAWCNSVVTRYPHLKTDRFGGHP
jgi:uncharacterized UBP type Zn finger protein